MIWLVFLNSTQTSPFRHPWLRGDLPATDFAMLLIYLFGIAKFLWNFGHALVPALLFLKQIIKKIYILSTWIKLASFLLEVLFLVEFIFSLTFTCHLACMDRISKLDSPFYLTFTHLLACMGRISELNSPFFLTFTHLLACKGRISKLDSPFYLTFAHLLACMDRISKLDSPFYLTFTHLLACMGRNDEPCRQACKLHLLRKHNLARRCLEPHPMHSIVSSKLIRGIRRI